MQSSLDNININCDEGGNESKLQLQNRIPYQVEQEIFETIISNIYLQ